MINDILDFSQISNGKLRLNPVCFKLDEIIGDISKLIKFQAKKKGLCFTIENKFPPETALEVKSDPNRLKQVILNLLGNSLKFTQKGFIKITMEPAQTEEIRERGGAHPTVKISVSDSGCGIKPEDIGKLFRLFGKLESSEAKKTNEAGIGLGLAISQNLVKCLNQNKSNEEIKVISEYQKGSTFYFNLYPMTDFENDFEDMEITKNFDFFYNTDEGGKNHPPEFVLTPNEIIIPNFQRKNKHYQVLLVDDDLINMMVLTKYFSTFDDCKYDTAYNGLEALNLVKSQAKAGVYYDVILMDCNMPIMDGFEATREILNLVKAGIIQNIAIIASTANASQLDFENCFRNGMVDYLSKPYSRNQLRKILDKNLAITKI